MLLGVDVGGTFTDAVMLSASGLFRAKVPTRSDQSESVLQAARRVMESAGAAPGEISYFSHGMTTATNALLERKGALVASVATEGFRDILEIGRQNRSRLYDLCAQRPDPLVPEKLRLVARERTASTGVVEVLQPAEIERVVAQLEGLDVEAVAVCLLFSFLDSAHERMLGAAISARLPHLHVSLSSDVLPQFREYERFSTTAVDAYLTPVVSRYLSLLQTRIREAGLPEPAIMQSSGGVLPLEQAVTSASPLLLSGPAAGVVGAIYASRRSEVDNLIAFDMGGTSTDVSLVRGGVPQMTSEREIGGQPVALPMVDIHTIGAGGGSIAWVDPGGALRVGPESAGAQPGPACYGRGGELATVTDANLVLGYLGERLGGEVGLMLTRQPAEAALGRLARKMGMGLEEAAWGIRRVVAAGMIKALRFISVERGHDPRQFVLVAFGGAGPMHGADLAEELGIGRVMLPESCGVLSALGMVVGDERRDWVRTVYAGLAGETRPLADLFNDMEAAHEPEIGGSRIGRRADMRYRGQSHELTVDVDKEMSFEDASEAFEREHERAYGYRADDEPVELVNIRLAAVRPLRRLEPPREPAAGLNARGFLPYSRNAYFNGEWIPAEVWRRDSLTSKPVCGPAIIEEDEATTVVPPGWACRLDAPGNLWLERLS